MRGVAKTLLGKGLSEPNYGGMIIGRIIPGKTYLVALDHRLAENVGLRRCIVH